MSLPPLLRHVYNHGTEEVIRRGKKIFYASGVQLLDVDHLLEQVRFRVRNDLYQNYYTVTVLKFLQPQDLSVRCQCPYNLGEICRHEVAALFQLNEILQSGFFENSDISYDQKHTIVRMRQISVQMLRVFSSAPIMEVAERWAAANKVIITTSKSDTIEAEVPDGDNTYKVVIKQNEDRYFDTACGCDEKGHPLCVHKAAVFLQILKKYGAQYFQGMHDWDIQKNKLLQQYGYSLSDDLTNKFTFTYEQGKPFLRVLDTSIKKISAAEKQLATPVEVVVAEEVKRLGLVVDTSVTWYPFSSVLLVAGYTDDDAKKYTSGIEKLELLQYVDPTKYRDEERELIPVARKFLPEEILKYLRKNLPFGDFLDDYTQVLKDTPATEVKEQVWEYLLPKYHKLFERYQNFNLSFLKTKAGALSSTVLSPVQFADPSVHPQLSVQKAGKGYDVTLSWAIDGRAVPHSDVHPFNAALFLYDYKLFCTGNIKEIAITEQFPPKGVLHISQKEWPTYLEQTLIPWSHNLHVNFDDELIETIEKAKPEYHLYLQERDQMLVLTPAFLYDNIEVKWGYFGDVIQPHEGVVRIVQRNEAAEQEFINMLRYMHSDMQQNFKEHFMYMPGTSVLANNWFFRFTDTMKEWNVVLFGFEGLKNLRINTHKPDTHVHVTSEIDWFDANIEIKFGEQSVTVEEVKKALTQKQNFVRLGDGSIGLLPEDWLKKYALLFKVGDTRGTRVRLKKYHFSVLDELLADVDEQALQQELEDKKAQLNSIITSDFSHIEPPVQLKALLRPYQLAGFQWLLFLKEAGWGGILADDMGLGKTVQTLTFFQHIKNTHPDAKFMVVCPTTLMYNWENEIKKFTPDLTNFIHHGPKRTSQAQVFEGFDVTITTYGTMRSDIKMFKDIVYDYVVLDESQSIKNPQSQVAKASLLLNSKNRLALSGTPVQNNTFDLYAQMNFLNPGMLGSREFFMNEFATPIDKFQEDEVKQQLKKLTYPFLLRRTKEQVAKDLPEKTETILFCEMGDEQRKIYESYRNTYRSQILGMIEERGIERSTMHILQGLTKLRQICDSPAILNEEHDYGNHSVKLEELTRELTENVGEHKALIFSQFLGMLGLIRDHLKKEGIPYAYFDGSSSSTERERNIQLFQNDDTCRVFLISLKAGGIGLNLTAADYVYIVDPWWNPAVEQQAIDRTHRIGQTKNIFAYRLICKETIEEKMLQLQERKRALANELVSDDNAFLKKLTKDDIAFLFS
ncbi:MAG: SNF2-related protein [Flavipsychrobacter sp.]|nr:SNF2-related protein [Flavipsychrobacter sp.]